MSTPTVSAAVSPVPTDRKGIGALSLLTIVWGSSFLLISLSLREFTPAEVVSARLILGGLFLVVMVYLTGQSMRGLAQHWKWLLVVGSLNYAIPFYSLAWAQQTVPSSTTAIFMSGIPLFTLLMTRVILRETVSTRRWLGFAIGFAGLVWLTGSASLDGLADLDDLSMRHGQFVLLIACIFFALGSIIIRRMPRMPALPATAVMLVTGGLILLPFGGYGAAGKAVDILAQDLSNPGPAVGILAALVFLALIPTGFGQFMRTFTIQSYGPVFYSIVGYLVPIWATILGIWILNETISVDVIVAFAVILAGLLLAHDGGYSMQPRSPAPSPEPVAPTKVQHPSKPG
ncbi:MAG: EamA family transporter [Burkholderiaceae bacterium]